MAYSFFDSLLDTSRGKGRTRRKLTLPVSIAIHSVVLVAVVVLPLVSFDDLPEPVMTGAIRAYLVEAAPPPPPPPPPPPAAAPKAVVKPRVETPRPVVEEAAFTAPIETPKEAPPADLIDTGLGAGEPGGVEGGVEGGVAGGTEGGEVGGVIGGVVGGTPGGVVGGVIGGIPEDEPKPPSGPVRVGGRIKAPAKIRNATPVYPPAARNARIEGTVILEATISPQGKVTGVRVLRGIPLLDAAAMDAVRNWAYSPTLLNGVPVPVVMTVTVNFRLES